MRRRIAAVLAESARRNEASARELRIIRVALRILFALCAVAWLAEKLM